MKPTKISLYKFGHCRLENNSKTTGLKNPTVNIKRFWEVELDPMILLITVNLMLDKSKCGLGQHKIRFAVCPNRIELYSVKMDSGRWVYDLLSVLEETIPVFWVYLSSKILCSRTHLFGSPILTQSWAIAWWNNFTSLALHKWQHRQAIFKFCFWESRWQLHFDTLDINKICRTWSEWWLITRKVEIL